MTVHALQPAPAIPPLPRAAPAHVPPPARAARRLRIVLAADALASALAGLTLLGLAEPLATLVFVTPDGIAAALRALGGGVLVVGAFVAMSAARRVPRAGAVGAILVVEALWVVAGVPLVALGPALTAPGMALVLASQLVVLVFAVLELALVVRTVAGAVARARAWARAALRVTALASGLFGLTFAFAPTLADAYWNQLLFRGAPPPEVSSGYARLLFGVLGVVITGWMTMLHGLVRGPMTRGDRQQADDAWRTVAGAVAVWFVADTAFSCVSRGMENAVSNSAWVLFFALPLAALAPWREAENEDGDEAPSSRGTFTP